MLAPSGPVGQEEVKDIKAVVKEVCSPERPGSLPLKVCLELLIGSNATQAILRCGSVH